MIIVKTPFRISFAGGSSDIETFYKRHPGMVVGTTINKYMYILIHNYFHNKIRLKYSRTEDVKTLSKIRHPLVKECLKLMKVKTGVEIASIADVPAGTGLGSSSAFTVGLLNALSAYKGIDRSKNWLAKTACHIEIDKVKEPIGKQDQYAVSFGGFNSIKFYPDETVLIKPIPIRPAVKRSLESSLIMFYTDVKRNAKDILIKQKRIMREKHKTAAVIEMTNIASHMRVALIRGNLKDFAGLLHEGWLLKRSLSKNISNSYLDRIYETARRSGAKGGKILGAGGGGFFLFYCPSEFHNKLRNNLGLRELRFKFEGNGSNVIFRESKG